MNIFQSLYSKWNRSREFPGITHIFFGNSRSREWKISGKWPTLNFDNFSKKLSSSSYCPSKNRVFFAWYILAPFLSNTTQFSLEITEKKQQENHHEPEIGNFIGHLSIPFVKCAKWGYHHHQGTNMSVEQTSRDSERLYERSPKRIWIRWCKPKWD